jgi:predicted ATPase
VQLLESTMSAPSIAHTFPGNLLAQPAALIGREQEVTKALGLLRQAGVRLLTFTGSGGTGKTSLALQIAADLRGDFVDGVFFVKLADISEPGLVPTAIANALNIAEHDDQPLIARLTNFLRDRHILLVLDNFEQVIAAALLIADLLAATLHLKVLVTSREVLSLYNQREFPVLPLALPELRSFPSVGANQVSAPLVPEDLIPGLAECAAVKLFIERAQAVRPNFKLTSENAWTVAEICVRLDGLPLAIELAAAHIRTMTSREVREGLDHRFKLLTTGLRDLSQRQQSLQATLDWSYELLASEEQALFARLAVFAGGITRNTAKAICGEQDTQIHRSIGTPKHKLLPIASSPYNIAISDGLNALVNKSLLRRVDVEDTEARFVMLETIREYARERLAENGEAEVMGRRHAEYFLAFAEDEDVKLTGPQQSMELQRLDDEHNNLRVALIWAREQGEAEIALRLGGSLWRFWYARGYLSEGRIWLKESLAQSHGVAPLVLAKALHGAGGLAHAQCDYTYARLCYEQSLSLRRELGDKLGSAHMLHNLGLVARDQGNTALAGSFYEESLILYRELDDKWAVAGSLNNLGQIADDQGDFTGAQTLYVESLSLYRETGDDSGVIKVLNNVGLTTLHQGDAAGARTFLEESLALSRKLGGKWDISNSLANLGSVALAQVDYAQAIDSYHESLTLLQELEDKQLIAECLEGMAGVAGAQAQTARSARLWGAAEALREKVGAPLSLADRPRYERMVAAARAQIEGSAWAAAWTMGREMVWKEAIVAALDNSQQPASGAA